LVFLVVFVMADLLVDVLRRKPGGRKVVSPHVRT
jgi:hypothetical protein